MPGTHDRRVGGRITGLARLTLRTASAVLLVGCGAAGDATGADGGIYIRYVGNPAGVYDAFCDLVGEEPPGRIVEVDTLEDEYLIDATYEYLPDGLKILDPTEEVRFADCHDYDLQTAVTAAVPPTTTTVLPDQTTTTGPPATPAAAPPSTLAP